MTFNEKKILKDNNKHRISSPYIFYYQNKEPFIIRKMRRQHLFTVETLQIIKIGSSTVWKSEQDNKHIHKHTELY